MQGFDPNGMSGPGFAPGMFSPAAVSLGATSMVSPVGGGATQRMSPDMSINEGSGDGQHMNPGRQLPT
jgi:hypothetical protein